MADKGARGIERLLILLALFKVRKLVESDLRLRTACDLEPESLVIKATRPEDFVLPSLTALEGAIEGILADNELKGLMTHTTISFNDELKKAKESKQSTSGDDPDVAKPADDDDDNADD